MDSKLKTGLLTLFTNEIKRASSLMGICEAAHDQSNAQLWRGYQQALETAQRETLHATDRTTLLEYMKGYVQGAAGRNDWDKDDLKKYEHMRIHGMLLGFNLARNAVQIT